MGPSMKEKLSRYFFYFMLYSIIGWIYEVFLEVVIYRWGYSNRGVLFGPYCVIYGVGALILLLSLQGLKKRSTGPEKKTRKGLIRSLVFKLMKKRSTGPLF